MKRFVSVILMLLAATFLFGAFAEPDNTVDPVPQDLMHRLDGIPQDCIVLDAPDGTIYAYIIQEYGSSLDGYRLNDGQWETVISGNDVLNSRSDAKFIRHQADQLRPDGTPYGDDQGFDIVAPGGIYDSYHWNGESYALCGWCDPERYNGRVIKGLIAPIVLLIASVLVTLLTLNTGIVWLLLVALTFFLMAIVGTVSAFTRNKFHRPTVEAASLRGAIERQRSDQAELAQTRATLAQCEVSTRNEMNQFLAASDAELATFKREFALKYPGVSLGS